MVVVVGGVRWVDGWCVCEGGAVGTETFGDSKGRRRMTGMRLLCVMPEQHSTARFKR